MKKELQELISLTEIFIYENYPIKTSKQQPVMASRVESTQPRIELASKEIKAIAEPYSPSQKENPSPIVESMPKRERDFSDIEKMFTQELSHIKLTKVLPDDRVAQEKAAEWKLAKPKPLAYIITSSETDRELRFLHNVASCITSRFGPACLLSVEELDESHLHSDLKCLIMAKTTASQNALLQKNLTSICFFDTIADYFTNPSSKAILWKAISNYLL